MEASLHSDLGCAGVPKNNFVWQSSTNHVIYGKARLLKTQGGRTANITCIFARNGPICPHPDILFPWTERYRRAEAPEPQVDGNEESSFPERSRTFSAGIRPKTTGTAPYSPLLDRSNCSSDAIYESSLAEERSPAKLLFDRDKLVTFWDLSSHVTPYQLHTPSVESRHPPEAVH